MLSLVLVAALLGALDARQITHVNRCGTDIWISPLTNAQGPVLGPGIQRIGNGGSVTYGIPDSGWGGRFWPKEGCDGSGNNCEIGQSMPPCGPTGCDPPAETKVEFFFPPINDAGSVWYDVSLVDGYSRSAEIIPSVQQGSCITTRCNVQLNNCPTGENSVGDLRLIKNGRTAECLSPCKKWNFPPPFGLGNPESNDPGLHFCCPTPPISPEDCRRGPVVNTQYVNLIHRDCPTAYSYAYDDEAGLHNCPVNVDFTVNWCF